MILLTLFHEGTFGTHFFLNFFDMVEVIGKSCVNVGERDRRNMGNNFIGRHAVVLMPYDDVQHADAMPVKARSTSTDVRRSYDPRCRIVHS